MDLFFVVHCAAQKNQLKPNADWPLAYGKKLGIYFILYLIIYYDNHRFKQSKKQQVY